MLSDWLISYPNLVTQSSSPQYKLQQVHENMIKRIEGGLSKAHCQQLAEALNSIQEEMNYKTNRKKFTKALSKAFDYTDIQVNNNLSVSSGSAKRAWNEFRNYSNQLKQSADGFTEDVKEELLKKARAESKKTRKQTGQAFESFLQGSIQSINSLKEQVVDENLKELVDIQAPNIVKNMTSSSKKNLENLKTAGAKNTCMTFYFGKEKISVSSQQKVDVSVPNPFSEDPLDTLHISAKNLSSLNHINILGKGKALSMIHAWPDINDNISTFYANLLTLYSFEGDLYERYKEMKLAFGIQSLIGHKSNNGDPYANTFIVNIRNRKNPIQVIPIKALLENILTSQDKYNAFIVDHTKVKLNGPGRTNQEDLTAQLKSIVVNTQLNKQYLSVSYLKKFFQES